jgi:hypothetical protein
MNGWKKEGEREVNRSRKRSLKVIAYDALVDVLSWLL